MSEFLAKLYNLRYRSYSKNQSLKEDDVIVHRLIILIPSIQKIFFDLVMKHLG